MHALHWQSFKAIPLLQGRAQSSLPSSDISFNSNVQNQTSGGDPDHPLSQNKA